MLLTKLSPKSYHEAKKDTRLVKVLLNLISERHTLADYSVKLLESYRQSEGTTTNFIRTWMFVQQEEYCIISGITLALTYKGLWNLYLLNNCS